MLVRRCVPSDLLLNLWPFLRFNNSPLLTFVQGARNGCAPRPALPGIRLEFLKDREILRYGDCEPAYGPRIAISSTFYEGKRSLIIGWQEWV